ncbi:hypothetical protein [Mycetocola reblochoni]|uniref:Lipoprotein n=2 Tax=Mycetocola reblochoni TaxID=331618 RepID=A0A1R4KB94_9MICO|nr:hypothetical protein [Mycetocola reblochoni]RLP69240.1 hypothetical protein D9V30_07965 [Mycetocola reblochoni]SJN41579.1 hypothetical protein FM119_12725 [Mycetocola reblochoni REB411]
MTTRRIAPILLGVAAIPVTLGLSGCSAFEPLLGGGSTSAVYRSTDAFADAAEKAGTSVPDWVTADATTIRVVYRDHGAILMTTPASDLAGCTDNGTTVEAPFIDSWWPLEPPATAKDCPGDWVVFTEGSSSYGYTTGSVRH